MATRPDHGYTLIEVLAALFVLAVGIAGAAAAQLTALRTRHATELASAGVQLAASLAERMRANPAQLQGGDAANAYLGLHYDADADAGAPQPPAVLCYAGASCSSAQLATFDLFEVRQALFEHFPGARIAVCRDRQAWDAARRALAWDCAGGAGAPIVVKLGWRDRGAGASASFAPAIAVVVAGAVE